MKTESFDAGERAVDQHRHERQQHAEDNEHRTQ
jgi:hypothetical protein